MKDGYLTRHSLIWLFAAQIVVIAPRLDMLPIWTALVWVAVAWWYWKIYRGDWRFPSKPVTWALAIIAVAGIALEYKTALALEPQVALLISAFILKLLELKRLRDHWLLLLLSYFLVGCGFIFSTSIATVAIALVQLLVLLMAQQALFRPTPEFKSMTATTLKLFGQSLPIMLVLFVIFPRFGPLWSVPLPSESGKTGMSESMSPGDVSKLSRSTELAFRVTFKDDIPAQRELYWRGLVLENFDGRQWSRDLFGQRWLEDFTPAGQGIAYEVILEHGVHEWLYAIAPARISREGVRQDINFQWLTNSSLLGRVRYEAESFPDTALQTAMEHYQRFKNLRLPDTYNPQARALASEWRELSSAEQRLAAAESFFRSRAFTYTLEPPILGRNSVDDFLFGERRGYCEHYASSLVVLMRAAGVPARVVVGYQGGERNESGGYLLVHQSDAHAWAEVWFPDEGWRRVDPTSWVAPDRIELGADIALAGESGFLGDSMVSLRKFSGMSLIADFRLFLDRVEYQWVRWIVNYDTDRQWDILRKLFGSIDNQSLALVILLALAVPLIVVGLTTISWQRRQQLAAETKAYLRCCELLKARGLERKTGETPRDFAARVEQAAPEWGEWIRRVTECFQRASYEPVDAHGYQESLAELRRLRRQAPLRMMRRKRA